ncbi:putative inactive tyrosine-protein kinase Wsck [Macrobrachium nipponense]|uniref:putative inactive tyrosine-protein kinase Wsck n=1 Tax=Macrobrachium nipponense TaxID=159736 RepID=UPI0030C7FB9E
MTPIFPLAAAVVLSCWCFTISAVDILEVGCFTKENENAEFVYRSNNTASAGSVDLCVEECKTKLMNYAALSGGEDCLCTNSITGNPSNFCRTPCKGNASQVCGGTDVMSIYETGHGIFGPPVSLTQVASKPSSLHINWEPPALGLSEIQEYLVTATPLFTYSESDPAVTMKWVFSAQTRTAWLYGVMPGTKYEISVRATADNGKVLGHPIKREMWTKVGKPETPAIPQILSRTPTTITVQLESVSPTAGPITTYQVVVVDETVHVELQPLSLGDYYSANRERIPFYIAAEFTPDNFMSTFIVGDGKMYGKYYNAPLQDGVDYHILLGVTSTINDTQSAYSTSNHEQHESTLDDDEVQKLKENPQVRQQLENHRKMILGLSIAIGLFGFLLVVSIVVYVMLRVMVKKNRRRSSENQELAINAQQPNQDSENGYAVAAHYVDEETPPLDHYRQLKERVLIIPHQGLTIVGDIGIGKFGDVKKGVVSNKGQQTDVLIHRIPDDTLDGTRKTKMLREFDAHVRIASHPHVISLIGLMEELNVISVAFEYEKSMLKTLLVESRAVQHYPVYAEKNRRFSTLPENQALDMLVGIARGMSHLSSLGVVHGQLCARNIVLVDGARPKLTGFGLLHYHNDLYVPDYRRWHSVETLRTKVSAPKSDVWSFGCLMWEVVTLGGTPYADVRTDEVPGRVLRGLRLPQPQYVADELYQVMLDCWQMDLDERPSFPELENTLSNLASDDVTPHLLFSLYQSFQYEQYAPHYEFVD